MEIHVHVHNAGMDCVSARLATITHKLELIMATLDQIIEKVSAQTTALESLDTLVEGLHQQIKDLKLNQVDQAKIDAVFAAVEKNDQKIVDAMTENVHPDPHPMP